MRTNPVGNGMLPSRRVLVCGGREYGLNRTDFTAQRRTERELDAVLDEAHALVGIGSIIHGNGGRADSLAHEWAMTRGIPSLAWPARWRTHGNPGGPIRNGYMLTLKPELVIAFPGGTGTADMVRQAKAAGVPVYQHRQFQHFTRETAPAELFIEQGRLL